MTDAITKTFKVKAHKDFNIQEAVEIKDFKEWMADAIGFKVLEFQIQNEAVTFTVQKYVKDQ
jgi:hypothetical protein